MGFKLINDYSKLLYDDCKKFIVNYFKEEIDSISDEFENINQIKQFEEFCLNVNYKIIDYKNKGGYIPN